MNKHELKLDTKYFEDVKSGKKNFEIRNNDRYFQVDDILELKRYSSIQSGYVVDNNLFSNSSKHADKIKVKVKSVIKAESWNMDKNFTDPLIFEDKMKFKHRIDGVSKVLKEYFDTEEVPEGYVVMAIEVVE